MDRKWTMRLIDDYAIPHWIIEEEVEELPNTVKRVGFCDSQEDAELIVAAPNLEAENADLLAALKRLVLAFDVGDMMHTTLNGRGYSALVESRKAIADAEAARKSPLHPCDVELPEGDK